MLKEIEEQGDVVGRTLQGRLAEEPVDIVLEDLALTDGELARCQRLKIVACGTSLHSALVGKFLIEGIAGVPVEVDFASEFRYRRPIIGPNEMVVAISQSGETADTLSAMREASKLGALPLAICNVEGSSIWREARGNILTDAGPEIGVASTKAFVGQLVALQLLALKLGRANGRLSIDQARQSIGQLRGIKSQVDRMLTAESRAAVERVAVKYASKPGFLFLGRGINYPIALEGALKLKEISYVHAEGYPAGEMKHGPIALISPEMVVVVIATAGRTFEKVASNLQEIRAREGRVIAIANPGAEEVFDHAEDVIVVPQVEEFLSPLVNVIPLQFFAYFIAKARGCDIDKPRNLAKSVTVE
jgi:glucosamine--fructose-6-phosphate aminotransferase (isomerizing)